MADGSIEYTAPASALEAMKGMLTDLRRRSYLWRKSLGDLAKQVAEQEAELARTEALVASFEEAIAKLEQPNG